MYREILILWNTIFVRSPTPLVWAYIKREQKHPPSWLFLPGQWSAFFHGDVWGGEALTVLVSVTLPGRWSLMDEHWTPEGPLINEPLINDNRTPASHQRDEGQAAPVWTSSSQHWLTPCSNEASSSISIHVSFLSEGKRSDCGQSVFAYNNTFSIRTNWYTPQKHLS